MAPKTFGVKTGPATVDDYRRAIQGVIDSTARSRRYEDGNSLASYFNSGREDWAAESRAFCGWRDSVWTWAYALFERVQSGEVGPPTVNEVLQDMPKIIWPL